MRFHHTALFSFFPHAATQTTESVDGAPQVSHGAPRYNAVDGTYEARVDVVRNGATFRYPVRVSAPRDADPIWISQALIRHALGLSDSPRLH